jgi:hypothetical protein
MGSREAIWVCDRNGPGTSDLLCSSDAAPGHAMRQDDDAVRSCTVAKCSMSCDFVASRSPTPSSFYRRRRVIWKAEPFAVEKLRGPYSARRDTLCIRRVCLHVLYVMHAMCS